MCIIQPTDADNNDWEREGAKMGEIYRNSTCTIAASSANDNTEGCCFGKTASQFDVHPAPLFDKPVHRNWDPFSKAMGRNTEWFPMMNPKPSSWLNHVQNSPTCRFHSTALVARAWTVDAGSFSFDSRSSSKNPLGKFCIICLCFPKLVRSVSKSRAIAIFSNF
jgi:hypothetical protein